MNASEGRSSMSEWFEQAHEDLMARDLLDAYFDVSVLHEILKSRMVHFGYIDRE
jgi:hypothetical protein